MLQCTVCSHAMPDDELTVETKVECEDKRARAEHLASSLRVKNKRRGCEGHVVVWVSDAGNIKLKVKDYETFVELPDDESVGSVHKIGDSVYMQLEDKNV